MKSSNQFPQMLVVIGSKLSELRVQKGYNTIKDFVAAFGLPEIQYWRIEKGKANITLKTLNRVLAIHNLSLHDFFCLVIEEEGA